MTEANSNRPTSANESQLPERSRSYWLDSVQAREFPKIIEDYSGAESY